VRAAVAAALALGLTAAPSFAAKEPPPIEEFAGLVQLVNAPTGGMGRFKVRIMRWSTDAERIAAKDALAAGGSKALVDAMEKIEPAAYFQIEMELRYPIRLASTWETDKGRMVRLATDRPIGAAEAYHGTVSKDYPVGIIEFLLPPEGPGEGILIVAADVAFDAEGRLEVKTTRQSTGAQRLTMVEKQQPKKKKKKSE
jgi:hypothetical protein